MEERRYMKSLTGSISCSRIQIFQNQLFSASRVFHMHPVSHNRAAAGQEGWNGLFVVIPKAAYMFRAPRSAGAQVNVTPLLCYLFSSRQP